MPALGINWNANQCNAFVNVFANAAVPRPPWVVAAAVGPAGAITATSLQQAIINHITVVPGRQVPARGVFLSAPLTQVEYGQVSDNLIAMCFDANLVAAAVALGAPLPGPIGTLFLLVDGKKVDAVPAVVMALQAPATQLFV